MLLFHVSPAPGSCSWFELECAGSGLVWASRPGKSNFHPIGTWKDTNGVQTVPGLRYDTQPRCDTKPSPTGWGLPKARSHLGQPKIIVKTPKRAGAVLLSATSLGCPVQGQQLGFPDPSSSGHSTVLCPTKAWKWAKSGELGILGSVCVGDYIWLSE